MKKRLLIEPAVHAKLREWPETDRIRGALALLELPEASGRPHVHAGIGIRKLAAHVFELRAGLAWRMIFVEEGDTLRVVMAGNHDEVQRFLRGR